MSASVPLGAPRGRQHGGDLIAVTPPHACAPAVGALATGERSAGALAA
ncbi:MAG: hypothetical protein RMM58_07390 [Chloroflexota bacterium]|nr:hypothetical protein [Dehalococcoidia bacterium]MDW8253683.1 hypothetical protein [Chloroflexota bacterium]